MLLYNYKSITVQNSYILFLQIMDESILLKLQVEYDCFFLRAILCIFSSRRLGAWQYLAAVPYHLISTNTLWQIFYILHTDSAQTTSGVCIQSKYSYAIRKFKKIINSNMDSDIVITLKIGRMN